MAGTSELGRGIVDKLKVDCAPSITQIHAQSGPQPVRCDLCARKERPVAQSSNTAQPEHPISLKEDVFQVRKVSKQKWNNLGTLVLVLAQTDVDSTNKSYRFDCRVALDKEGPIHDFAWSPNSKEFGVVYGLMPARVMLFDQRVRTLHDFGTPFYNFISFNPQSRLVLLGGFGNLTGKINVYDRRSLTKISTIDASNTSHCKRSPDGKFFLTATLSPRLRVENGINIWYLLGQLLHVQDCEELYQTSWRPTPVDSASPFPAVIPPSPSPSPSVRAATAIATAKPLPARTAGAYRPPGARGPRALLVNSRKEDGGSPSGTPRGGNSGAATPTRRPIGHGRRHVPDATEVSQNTDAGKPPKRKGPEEKRGARGNGSTGAGDGEPTAAAETRPAILAVETGELAVPDNEGPVPPTPGVELLDPVQTKVRNLNKKLKAI